MGGSYYDRDDNVVSNSSASVGVTSSLNKSLDPKRWATDKLVTTSKDPIVFALDVTGSMGEWTKVIKII